MMDSNTQSSLLHLIADFRDGLLKQPKYQEEILSKLTGFHKKVANHILKKPGKYSITVMSLGDEIIKWAKDNQKAMAGKLSRRKLIK
jgi:hypothetical protein